MAFQFEIVSAPKMVEKWIWVRVKREKQETNDDFFSCLGDNLKYNVTLQGEIEALEYVKVSGTSTEEIEAAANEANATYTTMGFNPFPANVQLYRLAGSNPMDALLDIYTISIELYFCYGRITHIPANLKSIVTDVVTNVRSQEQYQNMDLVFKVKVIEEPREFVFNPGDNSADSVQDVVNVKVAYNLGDSNSDPSTDIVKAMESWGIKYNLVAKLISDQNQSQTQ